MEERIDNLIFAARSALIAQVREALAVVGDHEGPSALQQNALPCDAVREMPSLRGGAPIATHKAFDWDQVPKGGHAHCKTRNSEAENSCRITSRAQTMGKLRQEAMLSSGATMGAIKGLAMVPARPPACAQPERTPARTSVPHWIKSDLQNLSTRPCATRGVRR